MITKDDLKRAYDILTKGFIASPTCLTCKCELDLIQGNHPYDVDHYQCPECDGTYPIKTDSQTEEG